MTGIILRKAQKLNDRYYLVRDVPVFAEHVKYAKDGRAEVIDERDLHAIVRRMRRFGPASVIIGHTNSDNQYDEQDVVGLAFGFRVSNGNDGKKYLVCDIITTNPDVLNKYPRRSIELWDDYTVNPIALLGSSTPKLDLPATIIKYSRKPAMDNKELVQEVLAAIQNTAEWKFLSQLLQEWEDLQSASQEVAEKVQDIGAEQAEKAEQVEKHEAEAEAMPFERDEGRDEVGDNEKVEHKDAEQDIELIEKLLNEYLEESGKDNEADVKKDEEQEGEQVVEKEVEKEKEPVKHGSYASKVAQKFSSPLPKKNGAQIHYQPMLKRQDSEEIVRLREELQRLHKERDELLAVYRREKRHTILNTLRTEGYDIDVDEELQYADKLDDSAFVEHVNRIRKYYRRAPTAPINPKFVRPTNVNLTQEMRDRAIEHATIKGITFEEAIQELYGIS